ncbi:MAG: Nif11-like leader peptide family natural product precursor [Alphaproteobacteria bacterium]|nr:Nif11-like leader peptide family natural product precursor [Alphaproteobacteria bacterium]
MSIEAAMKFAERIATREAVHAQVRNATAGKDEPSALAAVVALGKNEGFDFTADEAAQVRRTLMLIVKQRTGEELTDDELERVAGGMMTITDPFAQFTSNVPKPGPAAAPGWTKHVDKPMFTGW